VTVIAHFLHDLIGFVIFRVERRRPQLEAARRRGA
jgi:hypothetical protein